MQANVITMWIALALPGYCIARLIVPVARAFLQTTFSKCVVGARLRTVNAFPTRTAFEAHSCDWVAPSSRACIAAPALAIDPETTRRATLQTKRRQEASSTLATFPIIVALRTLAASACSIHCAGSAGKLGRRDALPRYAIALPACTAIIASL